MSQLKTVTDVLIYIGIITVIVCMGVLSRKITDHDDDATLRRLAITGHKQQLTTTPITFVKGPAANANSNNLAQSLNTSATSPWKLIEPGKAPKNAELTNNEDTHLGNTKSISSNKLSTVSLFVVRFTVAKDDLITFSGAFRSNCLHIAVYIGREARRAWENVSHTLYEGEKLLSYENPGATTGADQLHCATSLDAGVYYIGVRLTTQHALNIAMWFDGAVSGTLVDNIMIA